MTLNISDQVLLQIFHLALYFGAIILIAITAASLVGTWLQKITGTNDGTLSFLLRAATAVAITLFFGPSVFYSLQDILRMIWQG